MSRDLDVARAAAVAGAAEVAARFRPGGVREFARSKDGLARNLVTDADLAAEAAVLRVLREAFPGDAVVAEETAPSPGRTAPAARTWYVDPLDGTVNFAHGIPLVCVSVGLVVEGRPRLGVVHAPILGEVYAGEIGAGAAVGEAAIAVSGTARLAEAVLSTGFAYDRDRIADNNLDNFASVLMRCRGLRRGGSAALDLAWVAAGRFDGFWELWLNPWDVAAGAALVLAAGGEVTDMAGGQDWLTGRHIVASNGRLHAELLASLRAPSFAAGRRNPPPRGRGPLS